MSRRRNTPIAIWILLISPPAVFGFHYIAELLGVKFSATREVGHWFSASAATCLILAYFVYVLINMHIRRRPGQCPRCRYDVRGNESARCPECGLDLAISVRCPGCRRILRVPFSPETGSAHCE